MSGQIRKFNNFLHDPGTALSHAADIQVAKSLKMLHTEDWSLHRIFPSTRNSGGTPCPLAVCQKEIKNGRDLKDSTSNTSLPVTRMHTADTKLTGTAESSRLSAGNPTRLREREKCFLYYLQLGRLLPLILAQMPVSLCLPDCMQQKRQPWVRKSIYGMWCEQFHSFLFLLITYDSFPHQDHLTPPLLTRCSLQTLTPWRKG